MRALIVDDESAIREIYEDFLRSEMAFDEVLNAEDGLDAFLLSQNEKFDIILIDHMMPFMKGADFLVALRNKIGPNQNTLVIMISAYLPDLSESIKSIQNTFFMEKPADFERIKRYLKMVINS